jgi:hypothetical protein
MATDPQSTATRFEINSIFETSLTQCVANLVEQQQQQAVATAVLSQDIYNTFHNEPYKQELRVQP